MSHRRPSWVALALLAALTWLPAYALALVAIVAGWIVVPILSILGRVRQAASTVTGHPIEVWRDRWAWPWDNHEDGVGGPTVATNVRMQKWIEDWRGRSSWLRRIVWSAWRNPANNFKRHALGLRLDSSRMSWRGNATRVDHDIATLTARPRGPIWLWARQGWRTGVWIGWVTQIGAQEHRFLELRAGWKLYPGYVREADRDVGLTLQFGPRRVMRPRNG